MPLITFILSIVVWLSCLFMMLRIQWVFEVRTSVLHQQGYLYYRRLPSWECMAWHFWVWDLRKFLKREQA
ncbi:hypothetical protein GM31_16640 [Trabulsiella odontotermitis]|uniref:Uncharacterized protein n=1 Tax=Trabulsiella odontotermitis TaxID=379893 RepID=A0A0L0GZ76_9ENTR|nr:hypothetical protein GM31_16640 [Trabulsiella odontotermitis]